jgi:hypothetical protein
MQAAVSPPAAGHDDHATSEQLAAAAARIAELEAALATAQQQHQTTGSGSGTADGPANSAADGIGANAAEIQRLR